MDGESLLVLSLESWVLAAKTPRCWLIYILEVPGWAPQSSLLFSTSSHALDYSTCTEYQARHHYKNKEINKIPWFSEIFASLSLVSPMHEPFRDHQPSLLFSISCHTLDDSTCTENLTLHCCKNLKIANILQFWLFCAILSPLSPLNRPPDWSSTFNSVSK